MTGDFTLEFPEALIWKFNYLFSRFEVGLAVKIVKEGQKYPGVGEQADYHNFGQIVVIEKHPQQVTHDNDELTLEKKEIIFSLPIPLI